MKLNLNIKLITQQGIKMEDVVTWNIDALGLHIQYQDVHTTKVGDEMKDVVTVRQAWFNTNGILTVGEEFVKA